jgi:RHS repeat-associated protein
VSNTHQYAGEQLDSSGLYYNRNRYYNTGTGRFTQRDSYGGNAYSPVSQNRFIYGGDNPTAYTDHSGYYYDEGQGANGGQKVVVGAKSIDAVISRWDAGGGGSAWGEQPSIEVRIQNFHTLIVYYDGTTRRVYEGGPEGHPSPSDTIRSASSGLAFEADHIQVTARNYIPDDNLEKDGGKSKQAIELLSGPDVEQKRQCLDYNAKIMDSWGLHYDFLISNSNSVTRTFLETCNIPYDNDTLSSWNKPGWQTILKVPPKLCVIVGLDAECITLPDFARPLAGTWNF